VVSLITNMMGASYMETSVILCRRCPPMV